MEEIKSKRSGVIVAIAVALFSMALMIFQYAYIGITLKNQEIKNSKEIASLTSKEIANSIEVYFRDALTVTETYASNFLVYRQNQIPRQTIYKLMEGSLSLNNNFLAIWTIWEPNAYDNSDLHFRNDSIHDPKGTFAMTFYYQDQTIKREINDTSDIFEDFYAIPKKYKQSVILDPYYYQYHANPKMYFETSLLSPIMEDNKFLGVMGIDIDMYTLQTKYNKTKVYKDGYVCLLSNSGNIVTHRDPQFIEKNISDYTSLESTSVTDSLKTGKEFSTESYSLFMGEDVVRYFFPINFNYMAAPWYIMIEIPLRDVYGNLNALKIISSVLLAASLLLLLYLVFNITDRRFKEKVLLKTLHRIEQSEIELKKYQEHLEELVEERTWEVKQLNVKLLSLNSELRQVNERIQMQKDELTQALSNLKNTQEKLIISEKMASLGLFTAGIAHEINNPVNFISAGTQALFEQLSNLNDTEIGSHPEFINFILSAEVFKKGINTGIERTTEIISSLRNYATCNSETFVSYCLVKCIKDALVILQRLYKNRITIREEYSSDLLIECIPGKMNQVFINLISNSIDSIASDGEISIVAVDTEKEIIVRITDTGTGISPASLPKLFDPFYTTKEFGKGVGLGLYIVYSIIELHKGKIEITSEIGKGTTVTIYLPLNRL